MKAKMYRVDPDDDLHCVSHSFLPLCEDVFNDEDKNEDEDEDVAKSYLQSSRLEVYVKDALNILVTMKEPDTVGNKTKEPRRKVEKKPSSLRKRELAYRADRAGEDPLGFLLEHFHQIVQGQHVSGRRFEYISSTEWNKISFALLLKKSLAHIDRDRPVRVNDMHQLLLLLCPDFPFSIVQNAQITANPTHPTSEDESSAPDSEPKQGHGHDMKANFGDFLLSCQAWVLFPQFFRDICLHVFEIKSNHQEMWSKLAPKTQLRAGLRKFHDRYDIPYPFYVILEALKELDSSESDYVSCWMVLRLLSTNRSLIRSINPKLYSP